MSRETLSKKKYAKLLALALIFSVIAQANVIRMGKADPYADVEWVGPPPGSIPLAISVTSPNNNTAYRVNNLTISFTITAAGTSLNSLLGAYFKADWMQDNVIVYKQNIQNPQFPAFWNYSGNFSGIPDGSHSIVIYADGGGQYAKGLTAYLFDMTTTTVLNFTTRNIPTQISTDTQENVVPKSSTTGSDSQFTTQSISMPIEHVNYTVSIINGSFWATVDGNFPMHIPQEWIGQELPMVYPTPPGATNISLEMNGQKVGYNNYMQTNPDMLHYTYLGEWSMILFTIQPTSSDFLLTMHYQHPILQMNGTYMFLYDLNISPYLSNSSTQSTAYFNIQFQNHCSNINVYTVPGDSSTQRDNTKTPANFKISNEKGKQIVTFNITSDFSEPIPGDELVTFQQSQDQAPEFPPTAILSLFMALTVSIAFVFASIKRKKGKN